MSIKSFGPKFLNYLVVGHRKRKGSYWNINRLDIGEIAELKSYRANAKRKLRAGNRVKVAS